MKIHGVFPIVDLKSERAQLLLKKIRSRNAILDAGVRGTVVEIIRNVRASGDAAVKKYTQEFDGVTLERFRIPPEEITRAKSAVGSRLMSILEEAAANVRMFHENQKERSWTIHKEDGTILGQRVLPLERVAVYVPGGTAAYPSTVIMNAVPAQVAGVDEIIVITPPNKDGSVNLNVLATCAILGLENVYSVGGAQAIAAVAYGTESIPKVDKIVGPGNVYVTAAKKEVFGDVDIDMIAGPSEVVVLADSSANPAEVAADLLAQAEHDVNAAAILVTTDGRLARKVKRNIEVLLKGLERGRIASESIRTNGAAFVARTVSDAVALVNQIAPEHLELIARDSWEILGKIRNAGAVFLGEYSPEPVGDYFAGPSHVLPTGGTARFSSVLGVDAFVKRSSIIHYSRTAFENDSKKIQTFAENEGLTAHAMSIKIREKSGRKK